MNVRRLALLAPLALGLVAAPRGAVAQTEVVLTPFVGGTFFLADPPSRFAIERKGDDPIVVRDGGFDHTATVGLAAGIRLSELFAVEAMLSWVPTGLEAASLGRNVDATSLMYALSLMVHLPLEARVEPFLGVGAGAETFSYDMADWERHTEWMANVLAGFVVPVSEHTGVRFEVRDCITRFESGISGVDARAQNDLMVTVGISFDFSIGG